MVCGYHITASILPCVSAVRPMMSLACDNLAACISFEDILKSHTGHSYNWFFFYYEINNDLKSKTVPLTELT